MNMFQKVGQASVHTVTAVHHEIQAKVLKQCLATFSKKLFFLVEREVELSQSHWQNAIHHLKSRTLSVTRPRKIKIHCTKNYSPQARCKCPPCIAMYKLDRETFESMSIWYSSPYGLLKLFVPGGNSCAMLQLICCQCWCQNVT